MVMQPPPKEGRKGQCSQALAHVYLNNFSLWFHVIPIPNMWRLVYSFSEVESVQKTQSKVSGKSYNLERWVALIIS